MFKNKFMVPSTTNLKPLAGHDWRRRSLQFQKLEERVVLDSTVVFNELMYNPAGNSDGMLEWVELHNQLSVNMDISDWKLEGGIQYIFPDKTVVEGHSYLVIAVDPLALTMDTGYDRALGPYGGRLNNSGDALRLVNNDGRLMDTLQFDDGGEWPVASDGSGATLMKIDEQTASTVSLNWTFSPQVGGSPGVENIVDIDSVSPVHLLSMNEMGSSTAPEFWVELQNDADVAIDVTGFELTATGESGGTYVFPAETMPAGSFRVVTNQELGFRPSNGEKLFFYSPHQEQIVDGRLVSEQLRGRYEPFGDQWLYPEVATPGTANSFALHDEIVINEVMFHPFDFKTDAVTSQRVRTGMSATALVPDDATWETAWRGGNEPFNDSAWRTGTTGVGYDSIQIGVAPITHWTFDTLFEEGTVVPDEQGNYAATVSGATITSGGGGRFGEALSFDGDNDYVSPGVVAELVNPSVFSLSLWFQRSKDHADELEATNHSVNNVLIAQASSEANDNLEIGTENEYLEVYLDTEEMGGPIPPVREAVSIQNNQWHHLVLVYDSSALYELALYVDGRLVADYEEWGGLVTDSFSAPFTIGLSRPADNTWGDFEGLIDDVAIWDVALDRNHVAALFGGVPPSLFVRSVDLPIAYWAFDELREDNSIAPDEMGKYDGAVSGAVITAGSQGRFGEALFFDGDNDYVSPGIVEEFVSPTAFSASLWFRRDKNHVDELSMTNHAVNNVLLAQSSDGSNDNLEIGSENEFLEVYLDSEELGGPVSPIREPAAIQNGVWHHLVMTYNSDTSDDPFETKLYLDGSLVTQLEEWGGPVNDSGISPLSIGLARPDESETGDFEGLIDDVALWDTALDASHVSALFAGTSPLRLNNYSQQIGLNVLSDASMVEESTSVYVRLPFEVEQPDTVVSLSLNMQFNDAFVAYINGSEVARSNVFGDPSWNTSALSSRSTRESLHAVEFPIENRPGLLHRGNNMLAIHGMKHDTNRGAFLLLPELNVTVQPRSLPEWLELYNTSSSEVDLTGWSLGGGIGYVFPAGTVILPDSYLVVAKDADMMTQVDPRIDAIGSFSGSLDNRDDRIVLTDANKNPVDEVHYYDGGRWPEFADGGGSSLELKNPLADNSKAEVWAASAESEKSGWIHYTVRRVSSQDVAGATAMFNEFIFGLLDSGEFLIDDIMVVQDPDGEPHQLIQNGTFEKDVLGGPPETWRLIGNHRGTVVVDPQTTHNKVLHVIAAGAQAYVHDHAETTFVNNQQIVSGAVYEISFRAKWLAGNSQLNSRLYFNRISTTVVLDVPQLTGTPGTQNSTYQANVGPTFDSFGHFPIIPLRHQDVTVSVRAEDPDGVDVVTLWWNERGSDWRTVVMQLGEDGVYRGTIPRHNPNSEIQFYVEGQDTLGVKSSYPAAGADSRALYQVHNGSGASTGIDEFRIIMLPAEKQLLMADVNRMSNHFLPMTLVHNEQAFYDVSVRLVGSRWIRPNSGYKVRFHPDHALYGVHESVRFDLNGLAEIVMKQMVNRAGGTKSSMYDDIAFLRSPHSGHTHTVLVNLARYESLFLDEQFVNGAEGTKFELDDVTLPTNPRGGIEGLKTGTEVVTSADIGVSSATVQALGDDPEFYRGHLLIKSQRAKDDYDSIVALAQAIHKSGDELFEATNEIMDVDLWMRHYAQQSYLGNWDTYGFSRPKNLRIYFRPQDGKAIPFFWDCDLCNFTEPLFKYTEPTSRLDEIRDLPANIRLFWGHMLDLIQRSFNEEYVSVWAGHYGLLANQETHGGDENFMEIASSTRFRSNQALAQINSSIPQVPFEITTNDGASIQLDQSTVILEGTGWINVRQIRLAATTAALDVEWTDRTTWKVSIPVPFGENEIVLEAFDYQNRIIGSETIHIHTTANNPIEDSLRIVEINYNPYEPTVDELDVDPTLDNDDFEFIEIANAGDAVVSLQDVRLVGGVQFAFPVVQLQPGQRGVVVKDMNAFSLRYGSVENILGQYEGSLSNGGEGLTLVLGTKPVLEFVYSDDEPWPERADGIGASLELIAPADSIGDVYREFYSWRGSTEMGGSPGGPGMGPVGVVVNEVLSRPDASANDVIELYNATDSAMDVGGWLLSDSSKQFDKYELPVGTIIPAHGYLLLDENDFNDSGDPSRNFALNGADGDDVWLVEPAADGVRPNRFIDDVVFGATPMNESLGRWPNATGRFVPLTVSTLGEPNSVPRIGPVVISELMYNPLAPSDGSDATMLEFVEIYNPTARAIDLSRWEVDGINFQFASGTSLGPAELLVLVPFDPLNNVVATTDFENVYQVDMTASAVQYLGPYEGRLANEGEGVTLFRADAGWLDTLSLFVEDQVFYDDTLPWPLEADGSGQSLHRRRVDAWGNDPDAWIGRLASPGRMRPREFHVSQPLTKGIGEIGHINTVTHEPQTVTLIQSYANPVVFAQSASFVGADPIIVRVSNVQSNQFNIRVVEPSNLNGLHNAQEAVSYLVVEAGNHFLSDETQLEVGLLATSATVGKLLSSPMWEKVTFVDSFSVPPVVISQVQTIAGQDFLSTRHTSITEDEFYVALQQEEQSPEPHMAETVGYLAIEPGSGTWNGMLYEAQTTPANYVELFTPLVFDQHYTSVPNIITSLATYHGSDNAHLRYQNLTAASVELKVEEDTTRDTEIEHVPESAAYLAVDGSGSLTALATTVGDGQKHEFLIETVETGSIHDINVTLELVHSSVEDLDIFLEAPDSTTVELFSDVNSDSNIVKVTLDDEAFQSLTETTAPLLGRFRPEGSLRGIVGKHVNGIWTLHVTDDMSNDQEGTLIRWSLDIELAPSVLGNLNFDSELNAADIDLLFAQQSSDDPMFDLDGDGNVDRQDVNHLVQDIMGKRFGDADFDQDVDIVDFGILVSHFGTYKTGVAPGWGDGNFDGDRDVDIMDFNRLVNNFSPLGYGPMDTLMVANAVALRSDSPREPVHKVVKSDRLYQTDIRTLPNNRPTNSMDAVDEEFVLVDRYFRSSRRMPFKWFEKE